MIHNSRCVRIRLLLYLACLAAFTAIGKADNQPASPSPTPRLATFKERLTAAESVRVKTDLLGIELGSEVDAAQRKLDKWIDPSQQSKESAEKEEGERKVLWELTGTDFASIFVKADEENRITYMIGVLRPGKEIPFDRIGEVDKAPIRTDREIAWDVVRPNKSLIRVVANGSDSKANSITIFAVRPKIPR